MDFAAKIAFILIAVTTTVWYLIEQRKDQEPFNYGKIIWAICTGWLAGFCLYVVFFVDPAEQGQALTLYNRVKENGAVLAASIAASALAWDRFFNRTNQ
ncbi:hypothetical protein [Aliiglaciecola sp. M165]|uniref:hypothetical protein n=1 Tax=Aliiglaciecola sp. M165 TaxID=2593649 RepID=UPI00117DE91C|nr:hypothetical protein [Aliiglaciecola sp. M165]TRY29799.1 hypothetical protein FM019_16645 [Aliiglaciecola sp. M165]